MSAATKIWRCSECRSSFPKSKLLESHSRATKHKAYTCTRDAACRKSFKLRTALIRHEASHAEEKKHACQYCTKAFHRRDHCQEHEAICSGHHYAGESEITHPESTIYTEEMRIASLLTEMRTSQALLQSETQHSDGILSQDTDSRLQSVDKSAMLPSAITSSHSRDNATLNGHANATLNELPMNGDSGSDNADSRLRTLEVLSKLRFPEDFEDHPAPFQCSLCSNRFTRVYNLRSHMLTHTDVDPFTCTVCGKIFVRQHDRKRHEGLHTGEKTFVCEGILKTGHHWGCGRRFALANALRRHFRSESGQECIKPPLEEEAAVIRAQFSDQLAQAEHESIGPSTSHHGDTVDVWDIFGSSSLLEQHPALTEINWNTQTD